MWYALSYYPAVLNHHDFLYISPIVLHIGCIMVASLKTIFNFEHGVE